MHQGRQTVALGWPLRVVRLVILTGLTTTLGVGAHAVAAGELPPLPLLIMASAVIAGVALPMVQGRLTLTRLLVVVAGGQLGIHVLLTLAAHSAGHSHSEAGWQMVLSHTVAAGLCAFGLARGELYFWQLLTLITQRAQWLFADLWLAKVPAVKDETTSLREFGKHFRPHKLVRLPIPVRRGPPALSGC